MNARKRGKKVHITTILCNKHILARNELLIAIVNDGGKIRNENNDGPSRRDEVILIMSSVHFVQHYGTAF